MTDLKTACVEFVEEMANEHCYFYATLRQENCMRQERENLCFPCRARLVLQQAKTEESCSPTS